MGHWEDSCTVPPNVVTKKGSEYCLKPGNVVVENTHKPETPVPLVVEDVGNEKVMPLWGPWLVTSRIHQPRPLRTVSRGRREEEKGKGTIPSSSEPHSSSSKGTSPSATTSAANSPLDSNEWQKPSKVPRRCSPVVAEEGLGALDGEAWARFGPLGLLGDRMEVTLSTDSGPKDLTMVELGSCLLKWCRSPPKASDPVPMVASVPPMGFPLQVSCSLSSSVREPGVKGLASSGPPVSPSSFVLVECLSEVSSKEAVGAAAKGDSSSNLGSGTEPPVGKLTMKAGGDGKGKVEGEPGEAALTGKGGERLEKVGEGCKGKVMAVHVAVKQRPSPQLGPSGLELTEGSPAPPSASHLSGHGEGSHLWPNARR